MAAYTALQEEAFEANVEIKRQNLAIYTWGNASAFDVSKGMFAIKPSGVAYEELTPQSMVVVDLNGATVEGKLRPSSDMQTHLVLYRELGAAHGIRGITHTHSPYAVAWAQAQRAVPIFGTTHADHGTKEIPCTALISAEAVKNNYEEETGKLIVTTLKNGNVNPSLVTMVLVGGHGPFSWGTSAAASVYHAAVLEEVCKMAMLTLTLNPLAEPLPLHIMHKHWERKHGEGAYYGQ